MNWHLSTGRLSTIYPFQLQTPLHRVSPLPHLFTPFASQSQFTFHIVPLLDDRRKPLKWRSVLLRIPNGPSLTPRPLRSTVREFLSPISTTSGFIPEFRSESRRPIRPNAGHQIRNPNAGHTERRIHRISDLEFPTSENLSPEGYGCTFAEWGNHRPYIS